jgi:translation initiation factor IF-3
MGIDKALTLAHEKGLDLIEVSPKATPPVCKIMDYGKYLYQIRKAEQKQKKGMKKTEIKGIRLSLRTDVGDLNTKIKKAKEFLADGNVVKVQLMFKGREIIHNELGYAKMNIFKEALKDCARVDMYPKMQGHMMHMMLSPLK